MVGIWGEEELKDLLIEEGYPLLKERTFRMLLRNENEVIYGETELRHKLKELGNFELITKGIPDICLKYSDMQIWIEVKRTKEDKLREDQLAFMNNASEMGSPCYICYFNNHVIIPFNQYGEDLSQIEHDDLSKKLTDVLKEGTKELFE